MADRPSRISPRIIVTLLVTMVLVAIAGGGTVVAATPTTTTLTLAHDPINAMELQSYRITVRPAPGAGTVRLRSWDPDGARWVIVRSFAAQPGQTQFEHQQLRGVPGKVRFRAEYAGNATFSPSQSPSVTETVRLQPTSLSLTFTKPVQIAKGTELRVEYTPQNDDTQVQVSVRQAVEPFDQMVGPGTIQAPAGSSSGTTTLRSMPPGAYVIRAVLVQTATHKGAVVEVPLTVTGVPVTLGLELAKRYTLTDTTATITLGLEDETLLNLWLELWLDGTWKGVELTDGAGRTVAWTLGTEPGEAGPYHVVATTNDDRLAVVTVEDWFWWGTPPRGEVAIAGGDATTGSPDVVVDVTASDVEGVASVRLSNSGDRDGAGRLLHGETRPYAAQVPWSLHPADCDCASVERTVWVQWKDVHGTWSQPVEDSITLRVMAPPGVPRVGIATVSVPSLSRVPLRITWADPHATAGRNYRVSLLRGTSVLPVEGTFGLEPVVVVAGTGGTYRARVRSFDADGDASDWRSSAAFVPTSIAAGAGAIETTGRWTAQGVMRVTSAAGATASLVFTGRAAAIVARRGPGNGRFSVLVDGKKVSTVDLAATTNTDPMVVWTTSWGTRAKHRVTIRRDAGTINVTGVQLLK